MKNPMKYSAVVAGLMTSVVATAGTDWNCYDKKGTDFQSCVYIGAGLGYSHLNPDEDETGWMDSNKDNMGVMVYGGYHFAPQWFVEAAYADLGEVDVENVNPLVTTRGTLGYEVPNIMAGYYVDSGKLPIDPFVKAGISAIQNSASSSQIRYDQKNDIELALGAGFDWRFAKHWKLRNALESYDKDAVLYYLSVAYIFGEGKAKVVEPVVLPVPVPAPVAEPEPEPVVEALPPAPVITEELCEVFDGTLEGVHFKTASAELTDSAKKTLSLTAKVLKQFPTVNMEVHAHTDSQGSEAYNLELSMNRAKSVRAFFVSEGIDESRMTAEGFGEVQPIADNESAGGRALNRRVELVSHIEQCKKK